MKLSYVAHSLMAVVVITSGFILAQTVDQHLPSNKPLDKVSFFNIASENQRANSLSRVVAKTLEGTTGRYAVVIKNLRTEESFYLNEEESFESGSLYKLWVMATTYQQIREGRLTKEKVLSKEIKALNQTFQLGEDEAELSAGVITMTVAQALNQMITISHNYAALLLSDTVKTSNTAAFLKNNGFSQSSINSPPKTTAKDIALFYEKLYHKQLVDPLLSEQMIEILKAQQLNEGIPKLLPNGVTVAHKTGDLGWFKHDAGIVFTPKGDYIIVVLSESNSPLGGQERIAAISQAVYQYFQQG